jgi:hypothetical protein
MLRSKSVGAALIGLLVVSAISMAVASGSKPPKEQQTTVSLRRISGSEVMDILRTFPGMVPTYMAHKKNDTEYLTMAFQFSEVTTPALNRLFPNARFHKGLGIDESPASPYLMAVVGDKRSIMPGGFNRLLVDNGLQVTDENITELAKAFVVLAVGDQEAGLLSYPQITFLDGKKIKQVISGISYDAKLKVKVGEQAEEWYFDTKYGQFGVISRRDAKGLIKQYNPVEGRPPKEQGQLDETPSIDVDTASDAYVEYDTIPQPHYYLVVEKDSIPTNHKVTFSLSDFPPNARNVYIRVKDTIWAGVRHFHRVLIDGQGRGADTWTPRVESTGICWVGAGFADTTNPGPTYQDSTVRSELTPEKVITGLFPGAGNETLAVYFCDQFFKDDTTHGRGGESSEAANRPAPTLSRSPYSPVA